MLGHGSRRRKGDRGVPILGQDAVRKVMGKLIDERNDLVAGWDFEGAPPAEIVLDINDEQAVSWGCGHAGRFPESRCIFFSGNLKLLFQE